MRVLIGKYDVGFPDTVNSENEAVDFVLNIYQELDRETVKKAVKQVFKNVAPKPNKAEKKPSGSEEKDGDNNK
mgnify:CR=1 FL=1